MASGPRDADGEPSRRDAQTATRRGFLAGTAVSTLVGGALRSGAAAAAALDPIEASPAHVTRTWLGPAFWANRLEDWRLHEGRFECLKGTEAGLEVRTVALLTRELVPGPTGAHLAMQAALIEDAGGGGFCGFLIGVGGGRLDHRAAALAQRGSGEGGGFLCTYESDGRLRFREHTDESRPLALAELPAETVAGPPPGRPAAREVLLALDAVPERGGSFALTLSAFDRGGALLGRVVRRRVPDADLVGGVLLVSSAYPGKKGARFALSDVRAGGAKIARRPERAFGPILGTLHSLDGRVLKMSVQMAPVGDREPPEVRLAVRPAGGGRAWRDVAAARIQPGYVAILRVEGWDASGDHDYRVSWGDHHYQGIVRKDPTEKGTITVGLVSCVIASARTLEEGVDRALPPQTERLGRYTDKNLYFPHRDLARNLGRHRPDLLVFAGDQLYEGNPTRRDGGPAPVLDYLYKWYLWVWSFRDLARSTPAIVMVDDHDVYHGNLWGNGGRAAPERDQNRGGFRCTGEFVNLVQRTQCGHDPDPSDPTPVDQGIGVYYGRFGYGGVSFAVLEDRKWKTSPVQGADLDVHEAELLGERQHRFLAAWGKEGGADAARVCLTQTLFGCLQTSPTGRPLVDWDSNGYPKLERDRALALLRDANALVLGGDQHLGSVVRHGIDRFDDGPIQFCGPAGGSSWQRWFEPRAPLPNAAGPNTGDFVDAFGNKMRVLAVANPRVTFAEYRKHRRGRPQDLGQRSLKREGYGVVRVDKQARAFVLECWPWDVDPQGRGARQFEGWPVRVPFASAGRER